MRDGVSMSSDLSQGRNFSERNLKVASPLLKEKLL